MTFGPIVPAFGPSPARICILAEAPGSEESEALRPLVGPSGRELRRMLATIGANLDDCFKTNVFQRQPANNLLALYGTSEPSNLSRSLGPLTTNPITYIGEDHLQELERLRAELSACNPNIIIALGNVACWALGLGQGINSLRGTVHPVNFIPGRATKVLPTFHPAFILRQWDQRVIALADLEKALHESHTPTLTHDNTELWLAPSLADLARFDALHMASATICGADVETKRGQITCISFAPTPDVSLVVPFWVDGENPNYWPDLRSEAQAWGWMKKWCERPDLVKVTQNGLYDMQYIFKHGIRPINFTEDTMLAHHSLYSEMKKSLGFLGSIYANYPNWKSMRAYKLDEQIKRDDI